ncbi:MAG: ABC transporter substrate-binding protein, partial [Planktomarina sp.]|nr:ABC transporter substrate-binding protein [Planktomarina sp.]
MKKLNNLSRRGVIVSTLATLSVVATSFLSPALAQDVKKIKIGMVAPLSGPWARPGKLMRAGAEMAIAKINAEGGIESMGGAKLVLVAADAGDSADKAATAVRGLLASHPDLVAGSGAWLSSFTLAITEVTEREKLPWLTFSFSDKITGRGFKYVFQTSPKASTFANQAAPVAVALAKKSGAAPTSVGAIFDNTPNPSGFVKQLREKVFPELGLEMSIDEVFTPPLSDATPLIQRLRRAKPDFLYMLATNVSDYKLLLEKASEFGVKVPMLGHGGTLLDPGVLNAVGPELLDGMITTVAAWPNASHAEIAAKFVAESGEPFMTQDSIVPWAEMHILKEALERAGSADREAVAEQLRTMVLTEEEAANVWPGGVDFDETGMRKGANVMLVQWQNGSPVLVYPAELAAAEAIWPK